MRLLIIYILLLTVNYSYSEDWSAYAKVNIRLTNGHKINGYVDAGYYPYLKQIPKTDSSFKEYLWKISRNDSIDVLALVFNINDMAYYSENKQRFALTNIQTISALKFIPILNGQGMVRSHVLIHDTRWIKKEHTKYQIVNKGLTYFFVYSFSDSSPSKELICELKLAIDEIYKSKQGDKEILHHTVIDKLRENKMLLFSIFDY